MAIANKKKGKNFIRGKFTRLLLNRRALLQQQKKHLILENLPFFTSYNSVKILLNNLVSNMGCVKSVSLLHQNVIYTRTALVCMSNRRCVVEILRLKHPLVVDGKVIRVKRFHGLDKQKKTFSTIDKYRVVFRKMFSGYDATRYDKTKYSKTEARNNYKNDLPPNELNTKFAYQTLEDVFHRFNYKRIYMDTDEKNDFFHTGTAVVSFPGNVNFAQIINLSNEEFSLYAPEFYVRGERPVDERALLMDNWEMEIEDGLWGRLLIE